MKEYKVECTTGQLAVLRFLVEAESFADAGRVAEETAARDYHRRPEFDFPDVAVHRITFVRDIGAS